ncbi:MAG: DUF6152 family protein [Candidatus Rariloculaceae bacterium]
MPGRNWLSRRKFCAFPPVVVLCAGASSASSHHSHSNYMTTEYTHLQGVVREFQWMNPHTWIYLEVEDLDGQSVLWVLEGASPAELMRDGWSQDSVAVGDTILVRCHQLRDQAKGYLLGFLTPEGGVEKEFD